MNEEFLLNSYDYPLPEDQIAQFPAEKPGSSRLLVVDRLPSQNIFQDTVFDQLAAFLPKDCLLVANNSKVFPARLFGQRQGGGRVEFLLLTPPTLITEKVENGLHGAECLLRPAGKIKKGEILDLAPGLTAEVMEKGPFGRHMVNLSWTGDLLAIFEKYGALPLPPYIQRAPESSDKQRYQTCYAKIRGSVAAPTAGLHFTPEIKAELEKNGHEWLEVTLHVGYGTFSPVRCEDIRQHKMHSEFVEIDRETARKIGDAKKQGRPVAAIGTTSLRALEGAAARPEGFGPCKGLIDIFLYPGRPFAMTDCLLTNFHLPKSTLLMLVAAFAGRNKILAAYAHALNHGYKFFSYGDAMLIR